MKVMIVNNLLVYKILGTAAKFVNGNPPINNGRVILPFLVGVFYLQFVFIKYASTGRHRA